MKRLMLVFAILSLLPGSISPAVSHAAAEAAPATARGKTVLVLNSERSELPSVSDFERGLRSGLADSGGTTGVFVEYLDAGRFPHERHEAAFVRFLRERYAAHHIDVIVAVHDAAFEFALKHRATLFPDAYTIAAGVEKELVARQTLPDRTTIIPIVYDYPRTLELALALQPDLEEAIVIHGTSDYDLRRREEARRTLEARAPQLRYRMLGNIPLDAIEEDIRSLPGRRMVLLLSMVRDAEGKSLAGQDYARRLAQVSPAPIYGTFMSHMQQGTVGGAITEFGLIGRTTARIVSRVLTGDLPSGSTTVRVADTPWVVNWRAIERWKIPAARIPKDARVVSRVPGLWDAHRGTIFAIAGVLGLQGLLITGLLLQLRRRRQAEAALAESEERLRLGADAARLGMWGWNASRNQLWLTEKCRTLHGLPVDGEISFEDLAGSIHPEDRSRFRRVIEESLREQTSFIEENRVAHSSDDVRWIAARGRGMGGTTEPSKAFAVCADVSDRKRSEETLKLAVQALPTAILMVDRQGVIVLANSQAESMLGYGRGELHGVSTDILVPERLRRKSGGLDGRLAAPGAFSMAANQDLRARRKDGSEIPVEIALNPIGSGDDLLVLTAIVDLSQRYELRRKQQELEHVVRVSTLGEIAASLAHELSQPLAAILSNAQAGLWLMNGGNRDAAQIREILEDIVADDKRAGAVIGTLRTMLRKEKVEITRVDLSRTIREVLSLLNSELVAQNVNVVTDLGSDCIVMADATQMEQVALNLVMNGIDAMRKQPLSARSLRIAVRRADRDMVCVSICDSGSGIPRDELEKVFEAFWTTKALGMGMGLAVCRSIIKSWNGRIWVEANDDQGVTFNFTLPAAHAVAGSGIEGPAVTAT